jgi:hypothetical protein
MKVIAAEVAAHLGVGMLTRKAATESRATTGEMASAKAAAHASAAAKAAAHASAAAEPAAHVAATEPAAHMSATTDVSTPTTVSTPASPDARERVSGQSPGESGSRRQNDHGLA